MNLLAYVDAGSASFIFQAALGAFFATSLWVKSLLRRRRDREED